jgi:tRNA-dihydrouridine synthase A
MLDWTDTHFRYFIRLLSPHCFLYTEMITTGALLHGDAQRFLRFHPAEHPVALQLGGSDPEVLAQCALLAQQYDYDEINLNVGCPSDRVQSGRFGACLMKEPGLVAECVVAMKEAVGATGGRPPLVSVKCRLGVDEQQDFVLLESFIDILKNAGCDHVIVHARNAWLKGLSPKENREIPPLNYSWVYALKRSFPDLKIIINGGIKTVAEVLDHLQHVDGVMIGRPAYENPYVFRELERALFPEKVTLSGASPLSIVTQYLPYIEEHLNVGVKLSGLVRPIFGIFNGLSGSRHWRRYLSTHCHAPDADISVVMSALREFEKFSSI